MNTKQWQLIYLAVNYAVANLDDLREGYSGERNSDKTIFIDSLQTAIKISAYEMERLRELVKAETNEARKLSLAYYDLYPKESPATVLVNNPKMDAKNVWESSDCTFRNWLDRLRENPIHALAKSNWYGKVTKAYFKMIGLPLPINKKQIVEVVTEYLRKEQE